MNYNENLYICENHTNDCVILGSKKGFKIYHTNPFKFNFERNIDGGIDIIKMLYRTNIIVFVGSIDDKTLIIWDDLKRKIVGKIILNNKILNFELTREIIIIVTINNLHIYTLNSMNLIRKIPTYANNYGVCCIYDEIICYPSEKIGNIRILNYKDKINFTNIEAHFSKVKFITVSSNGQLIDSCSEKGTIIRIFKSFDGKLVKEFRRGLIPVNISQLKFSDDSKYLLCTSNKYTLHLYEINSKNSIFIPLYSANKLYFNFLVYIIYFKKNKIIVISDKKYYSIEYKEEFKIIKEDTY